MFEVRLTLSGITYHVYTKQGQVFFSQDGQEHSAHNASETALLATVLYSAIEELTEEKEF